MASLRTAAQQVLEEARDGIAWIALYREGRGWRAACFWPNIDRDGRFIFEPDDVQELEAILAIDPEAIFVNGYYTNLGPIEGMTRESLSSALRWQYEEHFNQLAEAVAETPSGASPGGVLSQPDDGRTNNRKEQQMNKYKIIYNPSESETETAYITERSEPAAVRQFAKLYGKDVGISGCELVEADVPATKEQERETLEKIKRMVAELGPHSYLATAFEGTFEDAETNIENDFAFSMKARVESAEGRVKELEDDLSRAHKRVTELERELANEEAKARSTDVGIEELIQKDEERKEAIIRMERQLMEARTSAGDAQRRAEDAESQVVQLKAKLYDFMIAQQ